MYIWVNSTSTNVKKMQLSGNSRQTVIDWTILCREVCTLSFEKEPKTYGQVQVDEAYFGGRAKYEKGSRLVGDLIAKAEEPSDLTENLLDDGKEKSETSTDTRLNVKRTWEFGLYQDTDTVRFVIISDRIGATLLSNIKKYVEMESLIISDECAGYNGLSDEGFRHETVCHKRSNVNPETGFHTQAIERSWADTKAVLLRNRGALKGRSCSEQIRLLQAQLDECAWRKSRSPCSNLLEAFLGDLKKYSTVNKFKFYF